MRKLWHYLLILLVVMLGGQTQDVQADTNFTNGLLAFVSNRDGNFEIYTVESDGTNLRNLTNNPATDTHPSWSPDGTKILFVSDRDNENYDLFVMEADGSNPRNLTNDVASVFFPAWSPDESQILFVSDRDNENYDLFVMEADGSNPRNLTNDIAYETFPTWSPDGSQITYGLFWEHENDVTSEVYILDADVSNTRQLTESSLTKFHPTWSPNGDKIVFYGLGENEAKLYIINSDGSELHSVTEVSDMGFPVWSPDGEYLAFALDPDPDDEADALDLFILNVTNSELRRIPHGEVDNSYTPIWSPDGQFLAAFAYNSGVSDLYVYAADGTGMQQITTGALRDVPIEFTFANPLVSWQRIEK